jgi:hypothetical protein
MDDEAIFKTEQPVQRFPRLSESAEEELLKEERERLTALARNLFSVRREVRIELGRVFIRIKATFKHGSWKPYFYQTFKDYRVSLRSVQRWMGLAHKADADLDDARVALLKPALDEQAVLVGEATAKAELEADRAPAEKAQSSVVFKLALRLNFQDQEAFRELQHSPNWPNAERKIVAYIKDLIEQFSDIHGGQGENTNAK